MKFIVTGDIHLKLWSDKEYDSSGLPKKLLEILGTLEQMGRYASDNNISTIVIAGDINDTKGVVAVRAFVLMRKIIEKFKEINWIILHGNHDATTGQDRQECSAIQLLDGLENAQLILEPICETFDNCKILLVPHSKDIVDVLQNELYGFDGESIPKILISHFGVDEAQLCSGISIKAGIRANDLVVFPLVLLGHYHTPQKIEHQNGVIYYTGSPIPVRRDEAHEEKRFLVVDTESLGVESIPTEGYRRYIELILDENTDIKELEQLITKYKDSGNHVILRKKIADIPLDIKETIFENVQLIDMYEKDINIRGINSSMTEEDQAKKYMEIMGISEEEKEEYLKVAMEIVSEE